MLTCAKFKADEEALTAWFKLLEAGWKNSIPLHICDPDASFFAVFERQEWDESSNEAKDVARLKRHAYIRPPNCSRCNPPSSQSPPHPSNPSTNEPSLKVSPSTEEPPPNPQPSTNGPPSNTPPLTDEPPSIVPPSADEPPSNVPPSNGEPPSNVPSSTDKPSPNTPPPSTDKPSSNTPPLIEDSPPSCSECNPELTLEMINSHGPSSIPVTTKGASSSSFRSSIHAKVSQWAT
jgi:hypothetical protein